MQLSLLIINIIAWHKFTIDYKGKETQNGEIEREREREREREILLKMDKSVYREIF